MEFEIENERFPIIIERKSGQKNTYIRVKKDLCVHVTTNRLTTNRSILKLINNNYNEIVKMINTQKKKRVNNDGFFYLGKKYEIVYIDEDKLYIKDDKVYMGKDYDIYKFYKKEASILFKERLYYLYENYSRKIPRPSLRIRKMTSRWGVCNTLTHMITLNLELIKRDTKYLDYVIIHELTHLVHADHSSDFWDVVEENMPDYKKYRKEMKNF